MVDKLFSIDPNCRKCDLCVGRTRVVGSRGASRLPIMIVAEAPGQNEDDLGIPLIGISGQMLEMMLMSIGLKSQDLYLTNVCKCRPPDNRKPTKREINLCKEYLYQEIVEVMPRYIVSLGSTAYYALVGKEPPMKDIVGSFTDRQLDYGIWSHNYTLVVLYHPSFLIRQNGMDVGSPKHKTWKTLIELKGRLDNENKQNTLGSIPKT